MPRGRPNSKKVIFNSKIKVRAISPNPKRDNIDYDQLSQKEYESSIKSFIKYVVDDIKRQSRDPLKILEWNSKIFNQYFNDYTQRRPVPWQSDVKKLDEIYDTLNEAVSTIIERNKLLREESGREIERMLKQNVSDIKKILVQIDSDLKNIGKSIFRSLYYINDNDQLAVYDQPISQILNDAQSYYTDFTDKLDKINNILSNPELLSNSNPIISIIPHEYSKFIELNSSIKSSIEVLLEELMRRAVNGDLDQIQDSDLVLNDPKYSKTYWSKIAKDFKIPNPMVITKGNGLPSKTRARRFVAGDISKGTGTGSKATDDILKKYGDWTVRGINVLRSPVESFVQTVSNWLSNGEFNKLKGKYDDIYHLAGIVWITDPQTGKDIYLKTERRPKIQWDMVKQFNVKVTDKLKSITVTLDNNQPTLTDLIHDSIKLTYGGTQYDQYDPVYSNCQRYILGLMNGLFKAAGKSTPSDMVAWISQDVTDLAKKSPIFHKIGKFVTDLAGKFQAGDLDEDEELAW